MPVTQLIAQRIDSLERIIVRKELTDTQRIDALAQLSRDLTFIDPVKAARYANDALQRSLKIGYKKGMANGYRILASIFSTHNKSIIAEEYLQRSMALFTEIRDSAGIANCYVTWGHFFRRIHNRTEEVKYHRQAFEIFSRLKIPSRIAVTAHNLGESYYYIGEFKKSRELTLYAIRLNDSLNNRSVLSNCFKVMGKLEMAAGNWVAAEDCFKKVLAISEELGPYSHKIAVIESLIDLAAIYKLQGRKDRSLSVLKEAASFCDKYQLADYLQIVYIELIRQHADQPDQVLHFIDEFNTVSLSVKSKLLKTEQELQQYGIEVYQFLEAAHRRTERDLILQEQRVKNKNRWLAASIATSVVLISLLMLLLRTLRQKKKAELDLKLKSAKLRELTAHLQNIREEERTKVASEIHEGLGQQLIVLKMDMAWLREKLGNINEKEGKRVDEISNLLDNAITTIRKLATELRPGVLDDIGLNTAIKWQLTEFEKQYGIKTTFRGPVNDELFTMEIKTCFFRILQEAITNAGRHSHAKKLDVDLQLTDNIALLTIADDGVGFDPGSDEAKKKLGILSMQERSYMIGGDFEVRSAPDTGTIIIIKAPVPQDSNG